jgi:hypothetical protein
VEEVTRKCLSGNSERAESNNLNNIISRSPRSQHNISAVGRGEISGGQ